MRSNFSVLGHPIHPMLVPLPIGLFIWALVADIIFLATDLAVWYEISRWSGAAGVVTGLLAAVPGIGDFLTIPIRGRARASAMTHMLLNLTIVAAFAIAGYLMFFTDATDGINLAIVVALHAAGVGLLLISGWLGGELVYRYHIGMEPAEPMSEVRQTR